MEWQDHDESRAKWITKVKRPNVSKALGYFARED